MLFSFQRALSCLVLGGALLLSLPAQAFCLMKPGHAIKSTPITAFDGYRRKQPKPRAVGMNRDKKGHVTSRDFGLMQINDRHIPQLRALGLITSEQDLLNNTCLNVQIGAWILAKHLKQCGVNWQCLGSYNAGFADNNGPRRMIYARKIYAMYMKLKGGAA